MKKFNIEKLIEKEKEVLQKVEEEGYRNPLLDSDRSKSLIIPFTGDRRYAYEFGYFDYSELNFDDQIRTVQIDTSWCKQKIAPEIKKYGLKDPVLVRRNASGKLIVVHGHNSSWSCNHIGMSKIPCIVITKAITAEGKPGWVGSELLSRIKPNRSAKNRQYTRQDAVLTITELMDKDPTINGLNPSGLLPPRRTQDDKFDFDSLMDMMYGRDADDDEGGFFLHPKDRTLIHNEVIAKRSGVKQVTMDDKFVTEELLLLGWAHGLKQSGKRPKEAIKHIDRPRKSVIAITDSNGENLNTKIMSIVKATHLSTRKVWQKFQDTVDEESIKYIDIFLRLNKPGFSPDKIEAKVKAQIVKVKELSEILKMLPGSLKIRYLYIPKHLEDSRDKSVLINLLDE